MKSILVVEDDEMLGAGLCYNLAVSYTHLDVYKRQPLDTIGGEKPEALPDSDQEILVYCRSGKRSEQASRKLVALGYTNIYDFGGINTWPYETE